MEMCPWALLDSRLFSVFIPSIYKLVQMHLPLKCLTYNVRGICDHAKWKLTWHYIYTCKADIVILQEHNQHEFAS